MQTAPPERRGIRIRVYDLRSDGTRRELPTVQETPDAPPCPSGVPGCTCLGERR